MLGRAAGSVDVYACDTTLVVKNPDTSAASGCPCVSVAVGGGVSLAVISCMSWGNGMHAMVAKGVVTRQTAQSAGVCSARSDCIVVISWLSERKPEDKLPDRDPTEIQPGGWLCSRRANEALRRVVDVFVEVTRDQEMG